MNENFDTPRSEAYFVQSTYEPRTCDVLATFPWRFSDVSVFVWNFTFSPRITCYMELGGSGNSEVNNGRQIRLGVVFILFYFQLTSILEILTYRTYKV